MLEAMIASWNGNISVGVYVDENTNLQALNQLYARTENDGTNRSLDVHLLHKSSSGDAHYPINNLRNLALREAQADYVFLLDVDFTVHNLSATLSTEIKQMTGKQAFVVPAFEPLKKNL